MVPTSTSCHSLKTKKEKSWPYYEYYLGEQDQESRKHREGMNHWTGAKSIEWNSGNFFRNTMHGRGDYCWCYRGRRGLFASYEGNFYVNSIHGYGAMSYPDGKVFTGLFNKDVRYGPGVESFACRRENVGLWRGIQLVRVPWRPAVPSIIPELHTGMIGKPFVNPHRIVLRSAYQTIGKVNSALELLKQCGSPPITAAENWPRLYPKYCTDTASALCNVEMFDKEYYDGIVFSLEQGDTKNENYEDVEPESEENFAAICSYYAWNNNEVTIDMMKHCFKHEWQRENSGFRKIDLESVLSGPRKNFQRPATHELDSRTLLMAAYLGHVASTAFLVNERGVDPNMSDMQGNTAVMYAVCGNQTDIFNFLVEAGADVDSFNDSCCTALGIALMRFACAQADIPAGGAVQAMLPPSQPRTSPDSDNISEWNINRDLPPAPPGHTLNKSPSKTAKLNQDRSITKKDKSSTSVKDVSIQKKKEPSKEETGYDSDVSLNDENKLYIDINYEYVTSVNELFSVPNLQHKYLFDTRDMVQEINDEPQIVIKPEKGVKKAVSSKGLKELLKPTSETMWQNVDGTERDSQTSFEIRKTELLDSVKLTIQKLLELGANPKLVRCPHPALLIAIVSSCSDLVSQLLSHGANVNEINPGMFGYSMLDVAVAQPLTYDSYRIIAVLLQNGARTDCRLRSVEVPPAQPTNSSQLVPGPTLLHAVLARKPRNEAEEDIQKEVLELLLDYNCDPMAQFKGRSAFEDATKNMDLLDIFLKSPATDLNGVINDSNQTILVKMFSIPFFQTVDNNERLQTLTNLLLFGADPLMDCRNRDTQYRNLFEFAKKTLVEMESGPPVKHSAPAPTNVKKDPKKVDKSKSGQTIKTGMDEPGNYRQAIDLVRECARILHIRWLQGKLTKELIKVIYKYKHRPWPTILKEHKNQKAAGLWLVPQRCLEIWALLKSTKRKKYNDKRTLKHLLCMVQFYSMRADTSYRLDPVTSTERDIVDDTIACMLKEHKEFMGFNLEMMSLKRVYVQPELFVNEDSKFDVCFECALPFEEERIKCESCNLLSFCSLECLKENVQRVGCHPCSDYLKAELLSTPSRSDIGMPDDLEDVLK